MLESFNVASGREIIIPAVSGLANNSVYKAGKQSKQLVTLLYRSDILSNDVETVMLLYFLI